MTLLVMLLTTATAWADTGVNYIGADGAVRNTYTDDGIPDASIIVINSSNKPTEIGAASTTTWCVVTEDVSYTSYVTFKGNVNLILADDANFTVRDYDDCSIFVNGGSLAIYAQSTGSTQGTITIAPYVYDSEYSTYANDGIYASGNINVYGGTINTTGIYHGIIFTGDISIYGGTLTATATATENGTGIYSSSGDITINGGQVTAIGEGSYGIEANGVTFTGGTVTATGDDNGIEASDVTINGGTVTATGNDNGYYSGIHAVTVTITGGTVTANGNYGIISSGEIIIDGGTIEATGNNKNGIFSSDGKITITSGTVTATGGIFNDTSSGITISGGKVTANGEEDGISSFGDIIIDGGDITVKVTGDGTNAGGIWTSGGDIIITSGNVTATATGNNGNGLFSGQTEDYFGKNGGTITISGGTVIANGNNSGIYAKTVEDNLSTITLSGGSVFAKASDDNLANSYRGNVIIADDLIYSDGTNTYEGSQTLDNDEKTAIAGKGMHPIQESYPLTANLANGDYWTTFYSNDDKYALSGDNASAYIATYDTGDEITLKELGKVIPKGTAVVIVANGNGTDASIDLTLTKSTDDVEFPQVVSGNKLRGVDVRTDKSILGSGTFYVMGKTIVSGVEHFGFHPYNGAYMPARKAYMLIGSSARSISMVFEETAGIKSIDKGQIGNVSDAWYSLDGRKLMEKPTTKGLYINNGKKVVIK